MSNGGVHGVLGAPADGGGDPLGLLGGSESWPREESSDADGRSPGGPAELSPRAQLLVEHFEEHLGRILALLVSFDGVSEVLLELAIDKPSDTVADQIAKVGATVWVEIQHTHAVSRYAVQAKIGVL